MLVLLLMSINNFINAFVHDIVVENTRYVLVLEALHAGPYII
jgi:hypothetical protein